MIFSRGFSSGVDGDSHIVILMQLLEAIKKYLELQYPQKSNGCFNNTPGHFVGREAS